MGKDSSVHLMYNDSCELGSLMLIRIILKQRTRNMLGGPIIETFRFEDENDYEYEIFQILFAYYHRYPGMLHCTFFTIKDNKMIKFLTFENFFPPLQHSR